MESILLSKEQLLITGDMNIHIDDNDNVDALKLIDLLDSFGLRQHVTQPTHERGHILDLLITRQADDIVKDSPYIDRFISDHASVLCKLVPPKPPLVVKTVTYRKIKSVDISSLKQNLATSSLCRDFSPVQIGLDPVHVDALVDNYKVTLSQVIETHAPLISKTIVVRPTVPWYGKEIDKAKRLRRKAERKWRETKMLSDWNVFKEKRNYATYLQNQAKQTFYTNFVEENSSDQRQLFRAAKQLLIKKQSLSFPDYQDKSVLVNDIGRFFVRKIDRIRNDIDAAVTTNGTIPDDLHVDDSQVMHTFHPLADEDVHALIQKSAKKSCILDPMPTSLVIDCLDPLLPVIRNILNSSLLAGYFPSAWKEALVNPLLKKTIIDSDFNNLRPVCNLQFISKLVERAVYDQMHEHMMRFGLYPLLQSAYRKGHSTETALLRVQNDLLMSMDRQHVVLLVLLDLSAAFDTVDHTILLSRLNTSFGIRGTVLDWFASYLSNRSQRVSLNGHYSDVFYLPHGIPQGSCLGPLLFTMYASKLFEVIKKHLPSVHVYADDTQLYLSFKPDDASNQSEAINAMELCVKDVRNWMLTDKLKINDRKTEFMVIGNRYQLAKVDVDHLTVGDVIVPSIPVVKNLGTWFDANLNFQLHINRICQAAYYHLINVRRIRKYLNSQSAQILVHAFIIGRIDYCNSILYGLPSVCLDKLQRLQNSAARVICNIPRYQHISPVLFSLHWLPVKSRIEFKVIVITFKAIHGLSPDYISDLINIKECSCYSLRSNNGLLLQPLNVITKKTLGDRTFSAAAPRLWNRLPQDIRNEDNFVKFKSLLKTHLFKLAF